jgi:hypothetical protein
LRYAGDLARVLGAEQLHVYLPGAATATAQRLAAAAVQNERITRFVAALTGGVPVVVHDDVDLATCTPQQLPPNPLVVSSELAMRRGDINILQPFEEGSVRRTQGAVLVPFGDGQAGPVAAAVALPLARALGLAVLFYHTTWPAAGQTSVNAVDHMYSASRAQHDRLGAMARAAGVQYRMEIEMADDVVMGMLGCALNGGVSPDHPVPVSLVVMSHGVNTCIGSYVEKTLNRASTPVLVVASPSAATATEGGKP